MLNATSPIIKIQNLHKNYDKNHAVKGINLEINEGEIFGIIGPDGAGKTTIFKILAGVMPFTEGSIKFFDKDIKVIRSEIGYITQQFSFYDDLTVIENIKYSAGLRNIPNNVFEERKDKYLELMGLEKFSSRLAGKLSGGMRQKLALCCVLVFQPKILFLDEPTTGVDPISRREFWDVLAALSADNVTIVVATPYLDEAERCNRIGLIYNGEFQQVGKPEEIRNNAGLNTLEEVFVSNLSQKGGHFNNAEITTIRSKIDTNKVAISTYSLNKTFGDFQAVKNFNFEVKYGEIYGLLGANGAGKTTAIKMLCGLLEASSGEICLAGQSENLRSSNLRQKIGYMSQKFTLYNDLTILENLKFYCGVYNVPKELQDSKIKWVLATSGLSGQENLLTADLPGGWKQRVSFGASVMHEPEILFLDEPTSGVDPLARRQFWKLINDFSSLGTAIIVTTHYLEEAEHCNRIAFMSNGEIIAEGTPNDIKNSQQGTVQELSVDLPQKANFVLKTKLESWRVTLFGNKLHLTLDNPNTEIPEIYAILRENNIKVFALRQIPFSLEDSFISIIKRSNEKAG